MVSNILLTCLREDIKLSTANYLSLKLDMILADIDELIKFDIINPEIVIEKVGVDYLNSIETKQVKNVASYENTLIVASDELLTKSKHFDIIKNTSLVIFVKLPYKSYSKYISSKCEGVLQPKDIIDLNIFYDKEKIFEKRADIVVDVRWLNVRHICKKVIKAIKNYYNKKSV